MEVKMSLKFFYLLCSVILASAHMTTICVEIKPSSPQDVPYYMCKGAELLKSGEIVDKSTQGKPQLHPNYGGDSKFQSPNNDNYGKSPVVPNSNIYGQTFPTSNEGYPSAEQSPYQKYSPPSIYKEPTVPKQQNAESYPTSNQAQSSGQLQKDYGSDSYLQPPSLPSESFQQSPFRKFQSLFANIKPSTLFAPNQSPSYDSIYNDQQEEQKPKDSSPTSSLYGIKSSSIGTKENYESASTPYASNNNGIYGASSYSNDAQSLSNSQRQQQNQQTTKSSGQGEKAQPRSPYGLPNVATVSTIPNANTPQPYGFRNLPYANPKGAQGVTNPMGTKSGTATPANAYVAPAAQKPSISSSAAEAPQALIKSSYLNPNEPKRQAPSQSPMFESLVRASQLQPSPRANSRYNSMMEDDVLDMPNIGFTRDEVRQFHRIPEQSSMLRIPDESNSREPLVGAPMPAPPGIIISGSERSIPLSGNPIVIGFSGQIMPRLNHDDDPVMRAFYGDLNEPNLLAQNNVMAEAYPIYPPQTNYPNYYPQQQPENRPTLPPKSIAYNPFEQAGRLDDGRCLTCPNSAPLQRPPQQCIAASDNGPTYAQPAPVNCVPRDYNIQPIFIAMPCYGQQPDVQVSNPQLIPLQQYPQPRPQQSGGPMIGSPLGLGGPLSPFGLFSPFNPFNPFRGILGASNPNFPNPNIGPPASPSPIVGAANQLGQFNFPTMRGFAERNQQQEVLPANGREEKITEQWKPKVAAPNGNKKTKVINFTTERPQESVESSSVEDLYDENIQQQKQEIDNANADPSTSETTTLGTSSTATTVDLLAKEAEKVSEVFTDSVSSTEDQPEDLSANSYLNLAEEKLQNSTPTEVKPSDVRKRQNVKTINSMLKRKYLQKF